MPAKKTNLIIACWLGSRNKRDPDYEKNSHFYLDYQLSQLQKLNHNLAQITFVIPGNYNYLFPKELGNTPVVVLQRDNWGYSYASWWAAYLKYRDQFDHYIFLEDDYLFIRDEFDSYLVSKFKAKKCSYLCSFIREKPLHAGVSNGITDYKTLKDIEQKMGHVLPGFPHKMFPGAGVRSQLLFSESLLKVGSLTDFSDDYRIPFNQADKLVFYGKLDGEDLIIPLQFASQLCQPHT